MLKILESESEGNRKTTDTFDEVKLSELCVLLGDMPKTAKRGFGEESWNESHEPQASSLLLGP